MPGLKDAPVPDYESDDKNVVSQQTEFVDDVFIYGKLYADITGEDINFDENTTFDGSITINKDLYVGGLSTFIGQVDMD